MSILGAPGFMTQRERLITDYTTFKLRQHALRCGARILLNPPEIDEFGYDITIEEGFNYLPVQLKTKLVKSSTDSWSILANFFTPSFYDMRDFDCTVNDINIGSHGGGGAVILQEFDEDVLDGLDDKVSYFYCDVFYILAIAKGFWQATGFSRDQAIKLLKEVQNTPAAERFKLPRAAFIPVSTPGVILKWRAHVGRNSNYMSVHLFDKSSKVSETGTYNISKLLQLELSEFIPENNTMNFKLYRTSLDN
ncbi:hypothetical protein [Rhodoblastus sp.]|uniref:hypothetical protein n=1 Tax=Rhodoblastus sp. TaxID=1962975 RepID=UPI0035B39CB8